MVGTLGTYPDLGCKIALTLPGANARQEGVADGVCKTPTLLGMLEMSRLRGEPSLGSETSQTLIP